MGTQFPYPFGKTNLPLGKTMIKMKIITLRLRDHKVWSMRMKCSLAVLVLVIGYSCKKINIDYPPLPDPNFVDLRLKDIVVLNLPSPYYHFEYGNDGHISKFDFATGWFYNMSYTGDNLTLMNNINPGLGNDSVQYIYSNDTLRLIVVTSNAGIPYRRGHITYNSAGQLEKLDWELKLPNEPFQNENSMTFSYYADGNVKDIVHHYSLTGSVPVDITFRDTYSNYDQMYNVDGFTRVHTSQMKPSIIMPGIIIQINNEGRVVRTGQAATTYEVNYSYTYDNVGRPVTKTGDFVATNGATAGQHVQLLTTYSYYN